MGQEYANWLVHGDDFMVVYTCQNFKTVLIFVQIRMKFKIVHFNTCS